MASIPGSVTVTGFIAPTDTTDTYAVVDPLYGIDGLRSCADTTERNNITTARRREGMLVYTRSDGNYWKLLSSPWNGTNSDWSLLSLVGSAGPQGNQGYQGFQGMIGPQGFQGDIGPQGFQGVSGFQGAIGPQGFQGEIGIGTQGFQGDIGPQGVAGLNGNNTTYVHTQSTPAATWTVNHGMEKYPSVEVLDSVGDQVFGGIEYIDTNSVELTFSIAISGTAYLN